MARLNKQLIEDEDDDVADDRHIIPDGGRVRVSLAVMDGVQRGIALAIRHAPGYVADAVHQPYNRAAADAAYADYTARVTDAWRHDAKPAIEPDEDEDDDENGNGNGDDDADEVARDQLKRRLSNAWRGPNASVPGPGPGYVAPQPTSDAADPRPALLAARERQLQDAWRTLKTK